MWKIVWESLFYWFLSKERIELCFFRDYYLKTNFSLPLRNQNFPFTSFLTQKQIFFKSTNVEVMKIRFPAEKVE